jgi:hypothetical protein
VNDYPKRALRKFSVKSLNDFTIIKPLSSGGQMSPSIKWETDLDLAKSMSVVQEKPIIVDFFNPG